MTPAETARILAAAASFDQRTVGTSDVAAWHAALSEVDFAAARDAVVKHYQRNRDRIMPVDVLRTVNAAQMVREVASWRDTNGHPFVAVEHGLCACGLPQANRHHLIEVSA